MQSSTEADPLGPLRCCCKHGEGIGGNGKLLEKVVVDYGVHIESTFIRMFDLAHHLPGCVIKRLSGGCLHFAVNAKSHADLLNILSQTGLRFCSGTRRQSELRVE